MRTLGVHELDMVSGGFGPAVIGVIKVGGAVVSGLATLAGMVYLGKKAIETGAELCKEGSDVTVRTPKADISCTGVQRPTAPASSPASGGLNSDDFLKARMPYDGSN